jgi:uncharacterized protein YbjT (DUF2867 family)
MALQREDATVKVIVFGPTGGTGRQLVAQALATSHELKAFARGAAALPPRPGLASSSATRATRARSSAPSLARMCSARSVVVHGDAARMSARARSRPSHRP